MRYWEVLYLFDNSDTDVVVFEDMDRYNTNQIFQRLREVNMLVNNRRMREGKTVLRFFYLLRDDIFVSKDRTKFFVGRVAPGFKDRYRKYI